MAGPTVDFGDDEKVLGPGDTVGNYTVDSLIGEGGMALVYKVTHTMLGSHHALKVLSTASRAVRARLLSEGRAQATMTHENVVAVTDVVDVNGAPGLVMQFIDGPCMDDYLEDEHLPLQNALKLYVGILRGVRHAHKRGLVHRDLKSANVMLQPHDDRGFVPKVTDFGLVKALNDDTGDDLKEDGRPKRRKTRTGAAMGTPEYMAPEQIRDSSDVDRRADMWSLGVILYEMVTGERPFQGDNMLGVFNAVCQGKYIPPREIVPDLPDGVVGAIDGLLQVQPNERIDNCDAVIQMFAQDEGIKTDAGMSGSGWLSAGSSGQWGGLPRVKTLPDMEVSGVWTESGGYRILPRKQVTFYAVVVIVVALISIQIGVMIAGGQVADPDSVPPTLDDVEAAVEDEGSADVEAPPADAGLDEGSGEAESGSAAAPAPAADPPPPTVPAPAPPTKVPVAPPPKPVAAPTGTVTWAGDARSVWLEKNGRKVDTGAVPAGDYVIKAWFNAPAPVDAGTVTVPAGGTVELRCSSFVNQCKVQ